MKTLLFRKVRSLLARSKESQRGTALLEFAIVGPLLILLIMGIVDISYLLLNFIALEQGAREGARTAGVIAQLSDSSQVNLDDPATYPGLIALCNSTQDWDTPTTQHCGHVLIHWRVRHVLKHHNLTSVCILPENFDIESEYKPLPASGGPVPEDDTISIKLTGRFDGIFWDYPMTVSYQGPYMYQKQLSP